MSHVYYNELWLITRSDLEKLLELERRLQENAPLKNRAALNSALSMYLRHVFKLTLWKCFVYVYNTKFKYNINNVVIY